MVNGMFTDRVKKVMQIAREEAVRLGNDYVGTEHLLMGLIKGEISGTPLAEVVVNRNPIDLRLLELARILATEEKQKNRRKG